MEEYNTDEPETLFHDNTTNTVHKSRVSPIESILSNNDLQEILEDLNRLERQGSYLTSKPHQINSEFFKKESSFLRQTSSANLKRGANSPAAKSRASSSGSSVKLLAEGDMEIRSSVLDKIQNFNSTYEI